MWIHRKVMFRKQMNRLQELLDMHSTRYPKLFQDFDLGRVRSIVAQSTIGYPIEVEKYPPNLIPRDESFLMGPAFTSARHPWPVDAKGNAMAPLLQLDLSILPGAHELWLPSDGLLQVWLTSGALSTSSCRIIPREDVIVAEASEVPAALQGDFLQNPDWHAGYFRPIKETLERFLHRYARQRGYTDAKHLRQVEPKLHSEATASYLDANYCEPTWLFSAIKTPVMYHCLDSDCLSALQTCEIALSSGGAGQRTADDVAALREAIGLTKQLMNAGAKAMALLCLRGTFSPIQYQPEDHGPCILCMESGRIGELMWGDCGNAQVFASPRGPYFEWSCY